MDDKADYDWGRKAEDELFKGVLTGSAMQPEGKPVPSWPDCDNHHEVQHRDRKPPWCNTCGWNRGHVIEPAQIGTPRQRPQT